MSKTGSALGRRLAAMMLAAAAALGLAGESIAQPLAPPTLHRQTAASALAGARAASTVANVPSPSETLYLRRRSDYASEAEMIAREIAIIEAETQSLRAFNRALEKDVSSSSRRARSLAEERLAAKRRVLAMLRRQLAEDRRRVSERLKGADGELGTTRHLRGQAKDKNLRDDREIWRDRERDLQKERDRLRGLLERVSELAANVG